MLLVNTNKGSSPTRSAELTTNVAVPRIEPVQRLFSELPKKRFVLEQAWSIREFFSGNIGCTNNLKNIRIFVCTYLNSLLWGWSIPSLNISWVQHNIQFIEESTFCRRHRSMEAGLKFVSGNRSNQKFPNNKLPINFPRVIKYVLYYQDRIVNTLCKMVDLMDRHEYYTGCT